MSSIVLVAEPEEIKLIPLAFKGLPILIAGVGENAANAVESINPKVVNRIINVGYCGAQDNIPIGALCKIGNRPGEYDCVTVRRFAESKDDLPYQYQGEANNYVVDMEYAVLKEWCSSNGVKLEAYKVVSDHLNFDEYKKKINEEQL